MSILKRSFALCPTIILMGALASCLADKNSVASPKQSLALVATHSFDAGFPVTNISFAPNGEAAWLGRLILSDAKNTLYSTDIEGRDITAVPDLLAIDHISVLNQSGKAKGNGKILVITPDHQLRAFTHSNEVGKGADIIGMNITPSQNMQSSFATLKPVGFCASTNALNEQLFLINDQGAVLRLTITVGEGSDDLFIDNIQTITTKTKVTGCAVSNNVLRYKSEGQSVLSFEMSEEPSTPTLASATPSPHLISMDMVKTAHSLGIETGATTAETGLVIRSLENADQSYGVTIGDGLSIKGIERPDTVFATQSNYGGASYAHGVIALVSSQENRIVFLSKIYVSDKIKQAQAAK